MPVDLSNPSGFTKWFTETVNQFRTEAIDDPMDGGDLDVLEDHKTGPVTASQLEAQQAYPFVWSVPQNHSPAYATTATDQGTLQIMVVMFAADAEAEAAFDKSVALAGRIVDHVEGSALVDDQGNAHASKVGVQNFQPDYQVSPGQSRAQIRTTQVIFDVGIERKYRS